MKTYTIEWCDVTGYTVSSMSQVPLDMVAGVVASIEENGCYLKDISAE